MGVFCIKVGDDKSSKTWHRGCIPITYPQIILLPWLSSVSRHGGHPVHYLMASLGWDIYPSAKCTQSCRLSCPLHTTWSLHLSSVDNLADIHRRSSSFPLIHPREVFLAWCWVIARPLSSHGVFSLSFPLGVGLTWVGLVHLSHAWQTPTHKGTSVSDITRRCQLQWRMHDCPHRSVTSYEGMSVVIWCTTSQGFSSNLSLISLFPLKVSALTKTRSPGFKSTVPIFQS